jgi:hypothetical protein
MKNNLISISYIFDFENNNVKTFAQMISAFLPEELDEFASFYDVKLY